MLFFDESKLEKMAKGNSHKYMGLFRDLVNKKLAVVTNLTPVHNSISFIVHPEPLLTCNIDLIYIIQYIKLCSKRSYFYYKETKDTSLDITLFPDLLLPNISGNQLLTINKQKINFRYER